MAAFQSQFSVSLELSHAIPQAALLVGKTYSAAMKLARELQSSGSDIVIEEDLTLLFGRCRVANNLASSFRTIVAKENRQSPIIAGIALLSGPGPTLLRAFTQPSDGPFMAMVIQCSLLVVVHESRSLGAALAQALEREMDGAPDDYERRSIPSIEGIRGVLQAIEDQASAFNWQNYLLSVAFTLGLGDQAVHETIPPTIFTCLMTVLSSVQRFPEERMLLIETDRAACVLVVWAHHILGLSVLVRLHRNSETEEFRFGASPDQVIIEVKEQWTRNSATGSQTRCLPCVVLLSADGNAVFNLKEEPDAEYIEGTFRGPAKGYARRMLLQIVSGRKNSNALIQDVMSIIIAMAAVFCSRLQIGKVNATADLNVDNWMPSKDNGSVDSYTSQGEDYTSRPGIRYPISMNRLYTSAKFLFDDDKGRISANTSTVDDYVKFFTGVPLYEIEEPPGPTSSILKDWTDSDTMWSNVRHYSLSLSIAVLAFAHVLNLDACSELPLNEDISALRETSFMIRLWRWDGMSTLDICGDDSFEIIASLLLGQSSGANTSTACLVSAKGWSIVLSSIDDADPAEIEKGYVSIRKGVPCRNNVWKHLIVDGPASRSSIYDSWTINKRSGEDITAGNRCITQYRKPFCGERGDSFLISLRLSQQIQLSDGREAIRHAGFNELSCALWPSLRTRSCAHIEARAQPHVLPPGCVAASSFADAGRGLEPSAKVHVCLTAGSKVSRWLALVAIATSSSSDPTTLPLLRSVDCCVKCALDQALASPAKCFLIL